MGIGSSEKEEQRRRKKKKGKGWVKMGHVRGTWVSKKNGRRKNGLGEGKKNNGPWNSGPGVKERKRKSNWAVQIRPRWREIKRSHVQCT